MPVRKIVSRLHDSGLNVETLESCIWAEHKTDKATVTIQIDLPVDSPKIYDGWVMLLDAGRELARYYFTFNDGNIRIDQFKSNEPGNGHGTTLYSLSEDVLRTLGGKIIELEPVQSAEEARVRNFWEGHGFENSGKTYMRKNL